MAALLSTTKRILSNALEDDIAGTAARVAYYFFLALFPGIIALFAFAGIVGGDAAFQWVMSHVREGLPPDAQAMLERFLSEITGQSRPGLLSVGILGVLWAASNSFNGLAIGLNRMYRVEENRSWWKRRLLAIGLLVGVALALNVGAAAILAGPELAEAVGLGDFVVYWSWGMAFALITALFWMTYYLLPNADQKDGKTQVLVGAVVGTLVWGAASGLFRLYVANFGNYSATYGFLGGVILLMLWLYITALAILFGGEVSATLQERRTTRREGEGAREARHPEEGREPRVRSPVDTSSPKRRAGRPSRRR